MTILSNISYSKSNKWALGILAEPVTNLVLDSNIVFNNSGSLNVIRSTSSNSLTVGWNETNPLFIDENNYDFSLNSSSPAIDNASSQSGQSTDFFGNSRDSNPDIGAIEAPDTTAPVITLIGDGAISHAQGTAYTDAGATATDNVDGDVTSSIVATGTVDVNTAGDYTITYAVSDAAGNAATAVTRTVTVSDTTLPVITLVGDAAVSHALGATYTDAGATATDDVDGDITTSITTSGTVDVNTAGDYTITYAVSDAAGNAAAQVTRTVTVESVGTDTDGDGVANDIDVCPNTPAGESVDVQGCAPSEQADAPQTGLPIWLLYEATK